MAPEFAPLSFESNLSLALVVALASQDPTAVVPPVICSGERATLQVRLGHGARMQVSPDWITRLAQRVTHCLVTQHLQAV